MLNPRCSTKGVDLGLELGWVWLEWGEGSAEKLRGERVGALGRVRGFGGVRVGEGGVDGEFRGNWRGECWGESWVCWSWLGEGWDCWSLVGEGEDWWSFCGGS